MLRQDLDKKAHTREASNYIADVIDKHIMRNDPEDYHVMSRIANDIVDMLEEGMSGMVGVDEIMFKKSLALHLENVMRYRFFKEEQ